MSTVPPESECQANTQIRVVLRPANKEIITDQANSHARIKQIQQQLLCRGGTLTAEAIHVFHDKRGAGGDVAGLSGSKKTSQSTLPAMLPAEATHTSINKAIRGRL
jgi:hypothetical protein